MGDDSFTNQRASLNYNPNQLGTGIRSENQNSENYNTEIKKKLSLTYSFGFLAVTETTITNQENRSTQCKV